MLYYDDVMCQLIGLSRKLPAGIRESLKHKPDLITYVTPVTKKTVLHLVVQNQCLHNPILLRTLIEEGVPINATTPGGQTAFDLVKRQGPIPMLQVLLDCGALSNDLRMTNKTLAFIKQRPYLHTYSFLLKYLTDRLTILTIMQNDQAKLAVMTQHIIIPAIIQEFLVNHPDHDVNLYDAFGNTALINVVNKSDVLDAAHLDIVEMLLKAGADPNRKSADSKTMMTYVIDAANNIRISVIKNYYGINYERIQQLMKVIADIIKLLILFEADLNGVLHRAALLVDEETRTFIIDALLKLGADVNQEWFGTTPLGVLCKYKPPDFEKSVRQITQYNDFNVQNQHNDYIFGKLIMEELTFSSVSTMEALLEVGINVKFDDDICPSPLFAIAAAFYGKISPQIPEILCRIFIRLIDIGLDVNYQIPVHTYSRHYQRMGLLPSYNPDPVQNRLFLGLYNIPPNEHILTVLTTNFGSHALFMRLMICKMLEKDIPQAIIQNAFLALARAFAQRVSTSRSGPASCAEFVFLFDKFMSSASSVNLIDKYDATLIGYMGLAYEPHGIILHNLIHDLLLRDADPDLGSLLPLVSIARSYKLCLREKPSRADFYTQIYHPVINLLLNFGAKADIQDISQASFWNHVNPLMKISYQIIYDREAYRKIHLFIMSEIRRCYHRIMYHPDRLRSRIHNIQHKLNETCYAEWLEHESGWLEYLGIHDFQSFREKMQEYVRFLD